MEKALASANGMLADVLEVGRTTQPTFQDCDPGALMDEALNEVLAIRSQRKIEVSKTYTHQRVVTADPLRLQRVLVNLIENALQVSADSDRLWLEVSEVRGNPHPVTRFVVGNSGSFIDAESRERVFDAFYTSGKTNGTGLGLAIAKKVIEAHGGEIWCESRGGDGVYLRDTCKQGMTLSSTPLVESC